jgi:hypothetical protein
MDGGSAELDLGAQDKAPDNALVGRTLYVSLAPRGAMK